MTEDKIAALEICIDAIITTLRLWQMNPESTATQRDQCREAVQSTLDAALHSPGCSDWALDHARNRLAGLQIPRLRIHGQD